MSNATYDAWEIVKRCEHSLRSRIEGGEIEDQDALCAQAYCNLRAAL